MKNENSPPEWYQKVEANVANEVIKVNKVKKVKNFYRVIGLSAPLLAAGAILAFAQPPSSSPLTSISQVNISSATKIQSTATVAPLIHKSTAVALKALKTNKSAIVNKDATYTSVSTQKTHLSSTPSPTSTLASGVNKPSIAGSIGGDDNNDD